MADRGDARSTGDLEVPAVGEHLDLEYTIYIDLELRSGEGLLEKSWGQATTRRAWRFWNHETMKLAPHSQHRGYCAHPCAARVQCDSVSTETAVNPKAAPMMFVSALKGTDETARATSGSTTGREKKPT